MLHSSLAVSPKAYKKATIVPKVETGGWKSVKVDKAISTNRASNKVQKQNRVSPLEQVIHWFFFFFLFLPSLFPLSLSGKVALLWLRYVSLIQHLLRWLAWSCELYWVTFLNVYLKAKSDLLPQVVHENFGTYSFEQYKSVFVAHLRWQYMMQEKICRVIIESDEEIDRDFSCLLEEETGS